MTRSFPVWWERFDWVVKLEGRFVTKRWYIDPGVSLLYYEATRCFIFGRFVASIAMVSAATERWLRWVVKKDRADFVDMVPLAESQGRISKGVSGRLDRMRDLMRNPVAHGKDEVMMGVLGWRRMSQRGWERPEGYEGYSGNESAAKEAIETFLLLVQESIQGGPGPAK